MYKKTRHLIHVYFQNQYRNHKLGQFGRIVEVDDSTFAHQTKGGVVSKVWVLGFYERGTKDVRAYVINDKNEETMTAMMKDNIAEGAEVITDGWEGYNKCKEFYTHRVSNKAK
jgi:IS1 family transposase